MFKAIGVSLVCAVMASLLFLLRCERESNRCQEGYRICLLTTLEPGLPVEGPGGVLARRGTCTSLFLSCEGAL